VPQPSVTTCKSGRKSVCADAKYAYHDLEPRFTDKSLKYRAGECRRREGQNAIATAFVESFFSLLKRGVVGTFHRASAQCLHLFWRSSTTPQLPEDFSRWRKSCCVKA
jgi:hypothetical protein